MGKRIGGHLCPRMGTTHKDKQLMNINASVIWHERNGEAPTKEVLTISKVDNDKTSIAITDSTIYSRINRV